MSSFLFVFDNLISPFTVSILMSNILTSLSQKSMNIMLNITE